MLEKLHQQAADLDVPPEVIVANDILEGYKGVLDYCGWLYKHFPTATAEAKVYRQNRLAADINKLRKTCRLLEVLTDERFNA